MRHYTLKQVKLIVPPDDNRVWWWRAYRARLFMREGWRR